MKPISLTISAYGPYKDEINIDFSKFNDIFLITGDTGAGKTTIFDAICYSLYNETSGTNRKVDSLRSDFASDETDTFVDFTFKHKDIIYNIRRTPSYFKKGRKTKTIADATLKYEDKIITGLSNVTEAINTILGIDSKQFKQISMIAQGDFLKLLLATSDERSLIFRKLFDTSIFYRISEKLKERFIKVKNTYDNNVILLNNELTHIKWEEEISSDKDTKEYISLLEEQLEKDKIKQKEIEQTNNLLNLEIESIQTKITLGIIDNENIVMLSRKNEELKKLELIYKEQEILKKNLQFNNTILPINENICNLELKIKKLENEIILNNKELENINEQIKNINEEYLTIDKRTNLLNEDKIKLNKIVENEKIKEQISNLKKKQTNFDINNLLKIKEKITSINEFLINDKSCQLLENSLKEEAKNKETIKNYELELEELEKLNEKHKEIEKNLQLSISSYNEYNKNYLENETMFLESQASILASTLKDGCPCIVCGSTNHPNIHKKREHVISIEELNMMKDNVVLKLETKNKLINELDIINMKIKDKNEESLIIELNKLKSIDFSIDKYKESVKYYNEQKLELIKLTNEQTNLETKLSEFEKSKTMIKTLEENLVNYDLDIISFKSNIIKEEENLKELSINYNNLINLEVSKKTSLEYLKKDLISNELELTNLNKKINELNYDGPLFERHIFNQLLETNNNYFDKYKNTKNSVSDLEKRTQNKKTTDITLLEDSLNLLKEKLENLDKSVLFRISNNKEILMKIKDYYDKFIKLDKEYSDYKILSDTANGTLNGKPKLLFEQFVQATYFNDIIRVSNVRLSQMTDGRFELIRKDKRDNLKDKLALELDVIDNYTGKIRDVKTLSGGESFKASLALSLGLSDIIQSYAGGIVVETLFIDEGFGSLDNESLDQALNTLNDLSEGNRLIGIISHVTELKERIDKKIIVSKTPSGSNLKIEY
ncbi:MAG: SMC family ATPase [Bacilli bacterium]